MRATDYTPVFCSRCRYACICRELGRPFGTRRMLHAAAHVFCRFRHVRYLGSESLETSAATTTPVLRNEILPVVWRLSELESTATSTMMMETTSDSLFKELVQVQQFLSSSRAAFFAPSLFKIKYCTFLSSFFSRSWCASDTQFLLYVCFWQTTAVLAPNFFFVFFECYPAD